MAGTEIDEAGDKATVDNDVVAAASIVDIALDGAKVDEVETAVIGLNRSSEAVRKRRPLDYGTSFIGNVRNEISRGVYVDRTTRRRDSAEIADSSSAETGIVEDPEFRS